MPIPIVERSEREMAHKIRRRVRSLQEVTDCKEVQMGFTRKKPNIHFHVLLKGEKSFEQTHTTCYNIDREVRTLVPNARVVIHSEPSNIPDSEGIWKLVKSTADKEPGSRGVQNIHLRINDGKLGVDFNLGTSAIVTRKRTNELETRLSEKLKEADARISEVFIHQESISDIVSGERWGYGSELKSYVEHVSKRFPELVWLGRPTIWKMGEGLHLVDRVAFLPGTTDAKAVQIRSEFGAAIKDGYAAITKVDVVEDPRTISDL